MRRRRAVVRAVAAMLTVSIAGGTATVIHQRAFGPQHVTARFQNVTGLYPGDEVRIAGVEVGSVEAVTPNGDQVDIELTVGRDIPVPADVTAVIVAPNLVSARYVQLTPAYVDDGPTLPDHGVIPLDRTAVPVEWDEVKRQLNRLATDLGPDPRSGDTSIARFIDSTADALGGNGAKLRDALTQLSGAGRVLSDNSSDIVAVIRGLQTFITALRDSNEQIVQFQGRLATLSSVLDGSRSDLDAALRDVADVVVDVQRFVAGTRTQTVEQLQRLTNVTQNVVEHQKDLEQILHVAPTALANTVNFFDPRDGGINGVFGLNNFSNPIAFICSAIGAVENVTAPETSKLCAQYLGPGLNTISFNYLPFPVNPYLAGVPSPSDMIYTEPGLAPGGPGGKPGPPETPPAVSAYTGAGDVAPPPGYGPPPPPPSSLPGLLLPATAPPPLPSPGPLLPAEATPAPVPAPAEGTPPP
ncbi:MCE family protein [Mycobacterium sp. 236(2023)]|uniref:MCE family protein n=1 Tax=Mycobacterium sp. 236(2023) TaxID=3038163 RepID=UPI002414D341|nr:MCE family protein [Mycobacterium sp. 236(2023)]MDG4669266.1 MCE family protein [Mycobacterium sp. 236(2023)]